jgi:hypothetical protein
MILLKPTATRCSNNGFDPFSLCRRIVTYPPPATGTNYNFIDKVAHASGDRIIWHGFNSPDGRFVYDYDVIRAKQQAIEKMCLGCHRVKVRGIKRLCDTCARIRKRASNRKSQFKRRSGVRKTGFSSLGVEALTDACLPSGYGDTNNGPHKVKPEITSVMSNGGHRHLSLQRV